MNLKHRVRVCRLDGNHLKYIPVFNDLALVVKAKDVDSGPVCIFEVWPKLMAVKHDHICLGNGTLEHNLFAGILRCHAVEILNERFLSISDVGVVLDVDLTSVQRDGLSGQLCRCIGYDNIVKSVQWAAAHPAGAAAAAIEGASV